MSVSFEIYFTSVTFDTIIWKENSVTGNSSPGQFIQLIHSKNKTPWLSWLYVKVVWNVLTTSAGKKRKI